MVCCRFPHSARDRRSRPLWDWERGPGLTTMQLLRCGRRRLPLWKVIALLLLLSPVSCWLLLSSIDVAGKTRYSLQPALRYINSAAYDTTYPFQGGGRLNGSHSQKEFVVDDKGGRANPPNSRLPKEVMEKTQHDGTHATVFPPPHKPTVRVGNPAPQVQRSSRLPESQNQSHAATVVQFRRSKPEQPPTPSQTGPDSLELLRRRLLQRNTEQRILNADKFPAAASLSGRLVLIVQVHRREAYLRHLLSSLRQAREIETVLLVISHDYYYDEIDKAVQDIDFCRVSPCHNSISYSSHSGLYYRYTG